MAVINSVYAQIIEFVEICKVTLSNSVNLDAICGFKNMANFGSNMIFLFNVNIYSYINVSVTVKEKTNNGIHYIHLLWTAGADSCEVS